MFTHVSLNPLIFLISHDVQEVMKHCPSQHSCREGGLSVNMAMSLAGKLLITQSQDLLKGADGSSQVHWAAPLQAQEINGFQIC